MGDDAAAKAAWLEERRREHCENFRRRSVQAAEPEAKAEAPTAEPKVITTKSGKQSLRARGCRNFEGRSGSCGFMVAGRHFSWYLNTSRHYRGGVLLSCIFVALAMPLGPLFHRG